MQNHRGRPAARRGSLPDAKRRYRRTSGSALRDPAPATPSVRASSPAGRNADTSSRSRLAADEIPDVIAVFVALHRLLDLQPSRARQLDLHFLADAPGARSQHDDAIAEINGLLDVVRHEDDGLAGALPQA